MPNLSCQRCWVGLEYCRSIQLKHSKKLLENLAWGSCYADLTKVQPRIGVPGLLITWTPKGGREGKKFTQLNSEFGNVIIHVAFIDVLTICKFHIEAWRFFTLRNVLCLINNREITTTWYYVNSRRHVDLEKIQVPGGIWTHDPPWSSRMLYHWATGDSCGVQGSNCGYWLEPHRAGTQPRTGSYELTNSRYPNPYESTCLLEFT